MYRLVAYGLGLLAVLCLTFSIIGTLDFAPSAILISLGSALAISYGVNRIMAHVWRAATNNESWLITALILFFILPPATTTRHAVAMVLAAIIAMASKYLLARHRKHLFNPAAFAAFAVGFSGLTHASWWVGSSLLWPFTLVLGLLVVRKMKRFPMLFSFVLAYIPVTVIQVMQNTPIQDTLVLAITSSPLIFLGTIMLTEPSTMPPLRKQQLIYGGLVGLLSALHLQFAGQYSSPELALLLGSLYVYAVSPKHKLRLRLKETQQMSESTYNYVFESDTKLDFNPGQYLEWTLPHAWPDDRGNRRTFTIASSPTEDTIQLGVKMYHPSSSFKNALQVMQPGDTLFAGQLAGNFTLPKDATKKLVFIAGGIGITPFRSMLQYLHDIQQRRDIVLFYLVSNPNEISYLDVLNQAISDGVTVIPVLGSPTPYPDWSGEIGYMTTELLQKYVPDLTERLFYLSGPRGMVDAITSTVRLSHVPRKHIKTDHFSGY